MNSGRFETRGLGGEQELIGSVEGRECWRQEYGVLAGGTGSVCER